MILTNKCLLAAIAFVCCHTICDAQEIQIDNSALNDGQGGYFAQWDSVQRKLLLYRDASASAVPAARIYAKDGTNLAIYPLEDLEESRYIDVWGVAATPEGGIVLAAVVGYTPRGVKPPQLKSTLLTYDGAGKLKSFWEVQPYQHQLVAVDHGGNVFAFGLKDADEPYTLIVKYSPVGKVLREFFPTSLLAKGEQTILPGPSGGGENQMFVANNELMVWVASSKELFRFSLAGDLVGRAQFSSFLDRFAASSGSKGIMVMQVAPTETGDLVAQVMFWGRQTPPDSSVSGLIRLAGDGSQGELLASTASNSKFLWISREGKPIYLQYEPAHKISTVTEH